MSHAPLTRYLIGLFLFLVFLVIVLAYFKVEPFAAMPIEIHISEGRDHPFSNADNKLMNTILFSQVPENVRREFKMGTFIAHAGTLSLPEKFDARKKWPEWILAPLNQAQCGSCWAFATSTAASDRLRIASNGRALTDKIIYYLHFGGQVNKVETVDILSPYQLAACNNCDIAMKYGSKEFAKWMLDSGECNKECNGGIIPFAFHFISKFGLTPMSCYYKQEKYREQYICDVDPNCPVFKGVSGDPQKDVVQLIGIDAIKQSLVERGPVVGGFTVYQSFMDQAKSKDVSPYPSPAVKQRQQNGQDSIVGGHAVAIVGYDKDPSGKEYWIIRNSWGPYNSLGGYFYMYINETDIEKGCYEIVM